VIRVLKFSSYGLSLISTKCGQLDTQLAAIYKNDLIFFIVCNNFWPFWVSTYLQQFFSNLLKPMSCRWNEYFLLQRQLNWTLIEKKLSGLREQKNSWTGKIPSELKRVTEYMVVVQSSVGRVSLLARWGSDNQWVSVGNIPRTTHLRMSVTGS
jgi:hypothetical protein